MAKGLFITFEGGEGSGKTTQAKLLSKWMSDRNIQHVLTKEPGCSELEECVKIRKVLLDPQNKLASRTELLLFLADRAQHVEKFIMPSLENGVHVICDRYSDSTRVYQSTRGLDRNKINMLIDYSTLGLEPDLTIIFDLPVEVGLIRARNGSQYENGDRIEREGIRFHETVRLGFLKLIESISNRDFYLIDSAPPKNIEEIHEEVVDKISKKLWRGSDE